MGIKVLIIGADGNLGTQLKKDFSYHYDVVGTCYENSVRGLSYLDITDREKVRDLLEKENPEIVILTSALTNVEECELNPKKAQKINVGGVKNIAEFCEGRKLVYYSTDAIFDGIKEEYVEEDIPNPLNVYGKTKLDGEKYVQGLNDFLIIRTCRLYGLRGTKFINTLISTLGDGNNINVPENSSGSPSFIGDVSNATLNLIKKERTGIYHIAGPKCSLDETAFIIAEVFGFDKNLISSVDKNFFNNNVKRASVVLNTDNIKKEGIFMRAMEKGIEKIMEDLLNTKFNEIKSCRACGSEDLFPYLNLGDMPLANNLLDKKQDILDEEKFPLKVLLCKNCFFSQLSIIVKPEVMFRNYVYRSSISETFKSHCKELSEELDKDLESNDLVVDVASNDGCLLRPFQANGKRVLGIDPAINLAKIANESGIETISEFWNEELATKIREKWGPAKIITAFNVFAHVADIKSFAMAVKILLAEDGYFIIESPHALSLLKNVEFDTIYHEHLSYITLSPLKIFFEKLGLRISKIKKFDIHGGSIRIYIEHDSQNRQDGSVEKVINEEEKEGLNNLELYENFKNNVESLKKELVEKLKEIKDEGGQISVFGASAKGNTLLNYFNIDNEMIDNILDDTPEKQGKIAPGVHIPIVSSDFLNEKTPDYLLILAWNFAEEIMKKTENYQLNGGKYIIPIPKLKII